MRQRAYGSKYTTKSVDGTWPWPKGSYMGSFPPQLGGGYRQRGVSDRRNAAQPPSPTPPDTCGALSSDEIQRSPSGDASLPKANTIVELPISHEAATGALPSLRPNKVAAVSESINARSPSLSSDAGWAYGSSGESDTTSSSSGSMPDRPVSSIDKHTSASLDAHSESDVDDVQEVTVVEYYSACEEADVNAGARPHIGLLCGMKGDVKLVAQDADECGITEANFSLRLDTVVYDAPITQAVLTMKRYDIRLLLWTGIEIVLTQRLNAQVQTRQSSIRHELSYSFKMQVNNWSCNSWD